ncbi:hypothetical protein [Chlamydia sp.]|uniref:hypothetical protein n=1 Tax=Chlamydia sp. TaxID=35827 RepID=UPI0025B80A66|nr:hypothetical protein [Chlamydia sp.]MBQ8498396.1 hypothetical protein [Chlamydia sp.]
MRIIPFDPYGLMAFQAIAKDPHERHSGSISEKIAEEISRNEALRMALLVIADQEDKEKKQGHKFKILTKKQTKVLLSQLRHFRFNFHKLQQGTGIVECSWDDETERFKSLGSRITRKSKKAIRIGTAAAQAIAHAAEAWVIARNERVLEMTLSLFHNKEDE